MHENVSSYIRVYCVDDLLRSPEGPLVIHVYEESRKENCLKKSLYTCTSKMK